MWKDYLSFSKSEQRGIISVLVILAIIICIRWYLANFSHPAPPDFSSFEQEVIAFENSLQDIETKKNFSNYDSLKSVYAHIELFLFDPNTCPVEDFKKLGLTDRQIGTLENYRSKGGHFYNADDFRKIYGIPEWQSDILADFISIPGHDKRNVENRKIELSPFDPNTASKEELLQLGIAEWIAVNIVKYREKGGLFKSKADLLKIYGIDTAKYLDLEPFIQLPEQNTTTEILTDTFAVADEVLFIGLNSADTATLKKLPGIGAVFADRIVKYRDLLGGYVDKNQLLEVYGMQQTKFEKITDLVFIDRDARKISINFATREELQAHPYLDFEQSQAIVKYRNKNGPFTSVRQLLEKGVLDENSFEKIAPYLKLKN